MRSVSLIGFQMTFMNDIAMFWSAARGTSSVQNLQPLTELPGWKFVEDEPCLDVEPRIVRIFFMGCPDNASAACSSLAIEIPRNPNETAAIHNHSEIAARPCERSKPPSFSIVGSLG